MSLATKYNLPFIFSYTFPIIITSLSHKENNNSTSVPSPLLICTASTFQQTHMT